MSMVKAEFLKAITQRVHEITSPMIGIATIFNGHVDVPNGSLLAEIWHYLARTIGVECLESAINAAYILRNLFDVYITNIEIPSDINELHKKANEIMMSYYDIACDERDNFSQEFSTFWAMNDITECYQSLANCDSVAEAIKEGYKEYYKRKQEDWLEKMEQHLSGVIELEPPIQGWVAELFHSFLLMYKSELGVMVKYCKLAREVQNKDDERETIVNMKSKKV